MKESPKERVHRYLDGATPQTEFTPDEIREIIEHEAIISEAEKLYRSIQVPDLTARITARLTAEAPASFVRRVWSWFLEPRPVRVRPAYAVAAAMAVVLLFVMTKANNPSLQELPGTPGGAPATAKIFVQFRLDAPQASTVHLAGSFTKWKPTYSLHETAPGIWSVLVPLEPGVHDYAFLINGKWIIDPLAPVVDDGFGGANSRLLVVEPDSKSRI